MFISEGDLAKRSSGDHVGYFLQTESLVAETTNVVAVRRDDSPQVKMRGHDEVKFTDLEVIMCSGSALLPEICENLVVGESA